jgi:hypothetical protein
MMSPGRDQGMPPSSCLQGDAVVLLEEHDSMAARTPRPILACSGFWRRAFPRLALSVVLLYCCAYGFVRWRKFIIMRDCLMIQDNRIFRVRWTEPGRDIRDDWRGNLKNKVNYPLFLAFRPLTLIEDLLRGGKTFERFASGNADLERLVGNGTAGSTR